MRTFVLLATLALLAATPLGLVEARHIGPCTHEYVEAARTGSPKVVLQTAVDCLHRIPCVFDACVLP